VAALAAYRQAVEHKRRRDRPGDLAVSLTALGRALLAAADTDEAVPFLEEAAALVEDLDDFRLTRASALTGLAATSGALHQPDNRDRVLQQIDAAGLAPTVLAAAWHSLGRALGRADPPRPERLAAAL